MSEAGRNDGPTQDPERAELDRLRAQVAQLRDRKGRAKRAGRWTASVVLLFLAALLGMLATVAGYVRGEVLDTNRYVATVAPLAADPAVKAAIANRITTEVVTQLDVPALTDQLINALEQQGAPKILGSLATPIENGVTTFIGKEVQAVVDSKQFEQLWTDANRAAHQGLDAVLTGHDGKLVTVKGTQVSLNLGALVADVKQRLVDRGFGLAANIPAISVSYPLFESDQIPRIQGYVKLLDTAAWVLPVAGVLLLVGGVLAAPNRRRALLIGASMLGVVMLLLLGGLATVRWYYLGHLPKAVESPPAAAVVYDTVLRFLVASAQTLVVLSAIVVLGCWLAGPGRLAGAVRRGVNWLLDAAARGIGRLGVRFGPVPAALARYRRGIELAAVLVALVALVAWRHPGVPGVLWTTVLVLFVAGLVELVARLPGGTRPVDVGPPGGVPAPAA